jgi:hypothetical protein
VRRWALLSVVLVLAGASPAFAQNGAPSRVSYRPPVDAPIVDPFRPPPTPYSAGNRGIDYQTAPGTPVGAAAPGDVVFAGPVGGSLHVVVLHADGIRTSYSFLRSISVHRGDHVEQGQEVGTAADDLHFGARAGDAYLDPTLLFSDGPPHVYLVPDEDRKAGTEAHERNGLLDSLAGLAQRAVVVPVEAVSWARNTVQAAAGEGVDELRGLAHYAQESQPYLHIARLGRVAWSWWQQSQHCTPSSVAAPRHEDRHIAVLVAGLGSSSADDGAAVWNVDTKTLGYDDTDVKRFSYRGGTSPVTPYDPSDTFVDIRQSARRLRDLLAEVHQENPGVPIDLIAHSQGGLVSRAALGDELDPGAPELPPINSLVTLGTPHQGADLATAAGMIGKGELGRLGLAVAGAAGAPVQGTSVRQLSETSDFIRHLNERPLPAGARVTSIGGRGDLVVPADRTHLNGARNVVVDVAGLLDRHSALPGSKAATREIALGQAGMDPTCQSLADMAADEVVSDGTGWAEDTVGGAGWAVSRASGIPGLSAPIHEGALP